MNKKRLKEWLKNVLIALLVISAVLLARQTEYYSSIARKLDNGSGMLPQNTQDVSSGGDYGAYVPGGIMVSGARDGKYGVIADGGELQRVFGKYAAFVSEALGSAGEPKPAEQADWRSALSGGVFFDYGNELPLAVLAAALETEMLSSAGDYPARMLCLVSGEDGVKLFYTADGESFYSCDTAVGATTLESVGAEFTSNEAFFAFERENYEGIQPYTLVLQTMPDIYALEVTNPLGADSDLQELFEVLNMNSRVFRQYTESDGTMVFVDNDKTLHVAGNGLVTFRLSENDGLQNSRVYSAVSAVNTAYSVAAFAEKYCGEGTLVLTELKRSADGKSTVCFDYTVGGIAVRSAEYDCAVSVKLSGDVITEASLNMRRFSSSEETELILPMDQVSAIVLSQGGGEPELVYEMNGTAARCVWAREQ